MDKAPSNHRERGTEQGQRRRGVAPEHVRETLAELWGDDLHAQRVLSLANGVVGVLHAAALSIHAIGQAYAAVADIQPCSGVKQVDRLLSNSGIMLDVVLRLWVEHVLCGRKQALVLLDWTDFEADDHVTLYAMLDSGHGRATPLYWKTVRKSQLAGRRTGIEREFIETLHGWVAPDVALTLVADRGFGDQALYELLTLYGWDYVIRFRGAIWVESSTGEARRADGWLDPSGRARMLRQVRVTGDRTPIAAVVVVKARGMKQTWCLATSLSGERATSVVQQYSRRMTIEQTFRDTKDLHFGLGLSATHIKNAQRRDRLLLLVAVAHWLLCLLGAAGERAGLDKYMNSHTKRRTYSLFRQGAYWFSALPNMRESWLVDLMVAFDEIVRDQPLARIFLGIE